VLGGLLQAQPQLAAAERPTAPLGVVGQTDPDASEFEAMRLGGVSTYRWLISWAAVQSNPDSEPDWASTDRVVTRLAENRITPLPFVWGSPCSVVGCGRDAPAPAPSQPPIGSPRARLAWAAFLTRLVDRYGPKGTFWSASPSTPYNPITTWQVWNEQNSPRSYSPSPSPEGYAELLAISARAIRSRDPEARILLGGMFGNPGGRGAIEAGAFLDDLYRIPGTERDFDAVAVHPYAPDTAGVTQQVREIRAVVESHGDAKTPIWVTELGWGASETGRGKLVDTVDGQARMLRDVFRLLLARSDDWNLADVLWYAWRDTPGEPVCDWCATAGLFDVEGGARPAWTAYAELAGGEAVELPGNGDGGTGAPVPVLLIAGGVALAALAAWLLSRRIGSR
jgi:hypothetical protein